MMTSRERRLVAIDALLADLRARRDHAEIAKTLAIRRRIERGIAPLKGAMAQRGRYNVKSPGRARELPALEPVT